MMLVIIFINLAKTSRDKTCTKPHQHPTAPPTCAVNFQN